MSLVYYFFSEHGVNVTGGRIWFTLSELD